MNIGKLFALTALLLPNKTNEVEKKELGENSGYSIDSVNQELYTKKADGTETVEKLNYYDLSEEQEKAKFAKEDAQKQKDDKPSVTIFGDEKASYMIDKEKNELTTITAKGEFKKEKIGFYDPFESAEKGSRQYTTQDGKPCDLEKDDFCYTEFVSSSKTAAPAKGEQKQEEIGSYDLFANAKKGKWQYTTRDGEPCDLEKDQFCYTEFVSSSKAERQV